MVSSVVPGIKHHSIHYNLVGFYAISEKAEEKTQLISTSFHLILDMHVLKGLKPALILNDKFHFFFKNIFLNIYVNSPVFMKLGGWIISFVGVKPKYILLCSSYQLITCSCNTKIYNCLPQQDKHWNTKTKIRKRMSTRHSYFNYSRL